MFGGDSEFESERRGHVMTSSVVNHMCVASRQRIDAFVAIGVECTWGTFTGVISLDMPIHHSEL